jgi:hypothetical protein
MKARGTLAAALLLAPVLGCAAPGVNVEEGIYTSPGGWFQIAVPTGTNPYVTEFEIEDDSGRGSEVSYDYVVFRIPDFGELFTAEVRSIPVPVLRQISVQTPEATRSKLANMFLADLNRELGGRPEVLRDIPFESHLGPALLRVFHVPKGSLLVRTEGGRSSRFDVLMAVIALHYGEHAVGLIAQNDYQPLDEESLVSRALDTFATLQLDLSAMEAR